MDIFSENLNDDERLASSNLLLAEPMLLDPNFQRTVILLCEHDEQNGSFGLVLNQEASVIIDDPELQPYLEGNLYIGGPVQTNTLHFIHTMPNVEGSISLGDGIFWGGDFEELKHLHRGGILNSGNCRFFLGYSGWSRGQLAEEVEQNSWVISRVSPKIVFEEEPSRLWKGILNRMGGKYAMFANYPIDPSQN